MSSFGDCHYDKKSAKRPAQKLKLRKEIKENQP
jgi:hypothetical protein